MKGSTDPAPAPRPVRVFHFSDTHLGHQQYPRTDAQGLNAREQDIARAFHAVIDLAVADGPDLVVHAGDLFDGVRPGNRALATAMEGFLKLSRAGIPLVIVAGNHEQPRMRETGSPMRLFAHLPGVHVAYQGHRETFTLDVRGTPVRVHAVPQCADDGALAAEVAAVARPGPGLDILVVHGAVSTLKAFSHAEFNELRLDPAWFDDRFDYVALGHYHGCTQVAPRAWYCGAPERVSIAESGEEKGFLDVEVAPGQASARFRPLPVRTCVDLPPIPAEGFDAATVRAACEGTLARVPDGAVCRLRVTGLAPDLRGSLDVRAIQRAGNRLLHLDLRLDWQDSPSHQRGAEHIGGLAEELEAFAAQTPITGADRAAVLAAARSLLQSPAPLRGPPLVQPGLEARA